MSTVLVADDDQTFVGLTQSVLEKNGFDVIVAKDGDAAIEMAQSAKPEIILCDVFMPKRSGPEVFLEVRRNEELAQTPFIFVSVDQNSATHRQAMNLGADDFLTKPVQAHDLVSTISSRLHRVLLDREVRQTGSERNSMIVASIAHDLQTPISVISLSLSLLRMRERRPDQVNEIYERIGDATKALADLTQQLLLFGKIRSGNMPIQLERVDLKDAVEKVVRNARFYDKDEHQIEVTFNGESVAMVDEVLFSQILGNLVSNSLKYSPNKGRVGLEFSVMPEEFLFKVRDDGIGIPEDFQETLFEPFQRGANAMHLKGNGVGLYIVKTYVDAHGGKIFCESVEGEGTQFTVSIPLGV